MSMHIMCTNMFGRDLVSIDDIEGGNHIRRLIMHTIKNKHMSTTLALNTCSHPKVRKIHD